MSEEEEEMVCMCIVHCASLREGRERKEEGTRTCERMGEEGGRDEKGRGILVKSVFFTGPPYTKLRGYDQL